MFDIKTNHENPPRNYIIFEEYFGNYIKQANLKLSREYLPIYWTNYYISKNYAQNDMSDIQNYLDSLDKSKKYFTVVQWDDGIVNNIDGLDLLIFASGGIGDYAIPLNSNFISEQPHIPIEQLKLFYSFVGSINGRHKVREIMANTIIDNSGFITDARYDYDSYLHIMSHSLFSLCPRGYGKTSFRIYESLMCGSIPVYIYDDPWIPYNDTLNFEDYGVLCHVSEIDSLLNKLKSFSKNQLENKRNCGKKIFQEYYTHSSIKNNIIKFLTQNIP